MTCKCLFNSVVHGFNANIAASKNPDNVIRGLKAAIHNPNVSEAGKKHAAEQLKEMGVEVDVEPELKTTSRSSHTKKSGGSTLSPLFPCCFFIDGSIAATQDRPDKSTEHGHGGHAGEVPAVREAGTDTSEDDTHKKAENRVMGGYKAATHSKSFKRQGSGLILSSIV